MARRNEIIKADYFIQKNGQWTDVNELSENELNRWKDRVATTFMDAAFGGRARPVEETV